MGGKPSNNMKMDRPESGGADKDMQSEKSGLLARDKEKFAEDMAEKRAEATEKPGKDGKAGEEHDLPRSQK